MGRKLGVHACQANKIAAGGALRRRTERVRVLTGDGECKRHAKELATREILIARFTVVVRAKAKLGKLVRPGRVAF